MLEVFVVGCVLVLYGTWRLLTSRLVLFIVVVVLIAALLGGCSATHYVEVGVGHNTGTDWDDGSAGPLGATLEIGSEWQVSNKVSIKCRVLHASQWLVGPPFNNRNESSLNHVGCSTRYEL